MSIFKRLSYLPAILLLFTFGGVCAYATSPEEIFSSYAVLMDADTGQVLFDKSMNARAYPASTTKIMTGVVAVENCFPNEILTVSESAVDIAEPQSANIALSPGEELTFENAMYAMMLPSANDAANVIAEHVAGSQEKFADLMNEKAVLAGAMNTHFSNAHGLHEDDHYTTAYDLALITRYAAGDEQFMRYFGTGLYTMPSTNLQPSERPFTNYQYMLVSSTRYYNENVIGGKVGYTGEARHTMSTVASKDGRTLICVVMGSDNRADKFKDTEKLLNFGFDEFKSITISAAQFGAFSVPVMDSEKPVGEALFKPKEDFSFLLHNSTEPSVVRFEYKAPDFIVKGAEPDLTVSLVAPDGESHAPSLLLTMALKAEINLDPVSVPVNHSIDNFQEAAELPNKTFYIVAFSCSAVLFVFFAALLKRYFKYKRRKARIARFNRLRTRAYSQDNQEGASSKGNRSYPA